jgi:spermidine dehydrogenase
MSTDKKLGMDKAITRRDFLNGVALFSTGAMAGSVLNGIGLSQGALAESVAQASTSASPSYPPLLSGMRGNHDGSFEIAHKYGRNGVADLGAVTVLENEIYDLVVVGAGISGLSAAYFYRQKNPQAKILILDNHDDFGGHAKRNEFIYNGKTIIGYGGSQTLQEPNFYDDKVKAMLSDIGIDLDRLAAGYDQDFFKRHDLRPGLHFQKGPWKKDVVIPVDVGFFDGYIPFKKASISLIDAVDQMPLSAAAKTEIRYLFSVNEDKLADMSEDKKWEYLYTTDYKKFLVEKLGIKEQEVFDLLDYCSIDSGLPLDALPALAAMDYGTLPGWAATGFPAEYRESPYKEPYIHHFPDGNASVARLLVNNLIPEVSNGDTMEEVLIAEFDYGKLDLLNSKVRVRLNSTAIRINHVGDIKKAKQTQVTYADEKGAYQITASHVVMACNNGMIPSICPEIPAPQQKALKTQVKSPIIYATVVVRNWRAWKKLGIGGVLSPKSYFNSAQIDFPVSLGEYKFATNEEQPTLIHLERFAYIPEQQLSDSEQFRMVRHQMVTTPFEEIERELRLQLDSLLGEAGFDSSRDIVGITINRWAHGYARWYNSLFSEHNYEDYQDKRYPHIQARKPLGRITIANSDAAATALLDSAVEEAYRAVEELV